MTKNKNNDTDDMVFKPEEKSFIIAGAVIKDGYCNYSYDVTKGIGLGDTHAVKGQGIVHDDMPDAFQKLNVHLACIDDVFKHSDVDFTSIRKVENNPLTTLYVVNGFKVSGSDDRESVVLEGEKQINCSGNRIALKTPKIPMDSLSSYKWYNELKEAVDECRKEVELYMNGKCTPPEEDLGNSKGTLTIGDNEPAEDEFENAEM
jgi:hypothetical protein